MVKCSDEEEDDDDYDGDNNDSDKEFYFIKFLVFDFLSNLPRILFFKQLSSLVFIPV